MDHQLTTLLPILHVVLVIEILVKLPVKSLLRFRAVCKEWRTIIDSRDFVNMHLSQSIQNGMNMNSGFLIMKGFFDNFSLYSVELKSLEEAVELKVPSWWPGVESVVASLRGSCNGLLCLSYNAEVLALWNPATKKQLLLPPLTFDDDLQRCNSFDSLFFDAFGFGFDFASDDYKVVNIRGHYDNCESKIIDTEAKVYSLRSNSWQRVYGFPKGQRYQDLGVFLRGSLHWIFNPLPSEDEQRDIIAFDLTMQEIHIVPYPSSCTDGYDYALLYVTGGCLSIGFYRYEVGCELWMLNEYGVGDSWTKLISIHDPNLIDRPRWEGGFSQLVPAFYSKNYGVLLFILYNNCYTEVFWYNFRSESTKKVPIRGLPKKFYGGELLVESLVSLDGWWS